MKWSPQQDEALRAIETWRRSGTLRQQVFRLFGYAGTGKTTLAKEIAATAGVVAFGAFTGKAALVMRSKGCVGASTIHSLIYRAEEQADGTFTYRINHDSEVKHADLVIIDECSMVDAEVGEDLLSFGVPVLVIGDPAQLPPVKGTGFFTAHDPDVMLTEIHRQARDNPIIRLATDVRNGIRLARADYVGDGHPTSRVVERDELTPSIVLKVGQLIVGTNRMRRAKNARYRALTGRAGDIPLPGERLICLKNRRARGLLNGGMWTMRSVVEQTNFWIKFKIEDEVVPGRIVEATVPLHFFQGREDELDTKTRNKFDEFDFGYVITAHKSQGSQWPDVAIIDESFVFKDIRDRWLYTAITRAASSVIVAQP